MIEAKRRKADGNGFVILSCDNLQVSDGGRKKDILKRSKILKFLEFKP